MVIMNDLEQLMLSYYVIYFEKFRKVMQQAEERSFKLLLSNFDILYQIS